MDDEQLAHLQRTAMAAARGGLKSALENAPQGKADLVALYCSSLGLIAAAAATVMEVENVAAMLGSAKPPQERRDAFIKMAGEIWDEIVATAARQRLQ